MKPYGTWGKESSDKKVMNIRVFTQSETGIRDKTMLFETSGQLTPDAMKVFTVLETLVKTEGHLKPS